MAQPAGDSIDMKPSSPTPAFTSADTLPRKQSIFKKLYNYLKHSNEDKTVTQDKKFDVSIIGGPHYSTAVGFGIGLVAAGLFRADRTDMTIPPSNVSLFGDVASTGFYMLGVRGNTFFKSGRIRFDYRTYFLSQPGGYWGVGYDAGMYNEKSTYLRQEYDFKPDFMVRVAHNFYLGTTLDFMHVAGRDFSNIDYVPAGEDTKYTVFGGGFFAMFDSRDVITSPYRGVYLRLEQQWFPAALGSSESFNRTELYFDYYHKLWKGAVLAFDLYSQVNSENAPWTMLGEMGGPYRMRGYYQGQYRDKGVLEVQLELRQRIYGRNGMTAWIGAGNVFPTYREFKISQTLPNYGIGYRWEFKKRVNVRLDYGFGKDQRGFIFNINEAF